MTHHSTNGHKHQRGQLAVITGLTALPIDMIFAMSVELVALSSERDRMQAAVDVAALAGASQLAVSGNLPKPSSDYAEDFVRRQPLCIVGLKNNHRGISIEANSTSAIQAENCLIHANGKIQTRQSRTIQAGAIRSTGTVSGDGLAHGAHSAALPVPNPFRDPSIVRSTTCCFGRLESVKLYGEWCHFVLLPGTHREKIVVSGTYALLGLPGQHTFCAGLTRQDKARLFGDDVVLVFDERSLVARSVITDKNGGLTINSDHEGSSVPVPVGVGNRAAAKKVSARLEQ